MRWSCTPAARCGMAAVSIGSPCHGPGCWQHRQVEVPEVITMSDLSPSAGDTGDAPSRRLPERDARTGDPPPPRVSPTSRAGSSSSCASRWSVATSTTCPATASRSRTSEASTTRTGGSRSSSSARTSRSSACARAAEGGRRARRPARPDQRRVRGASRGRGLQRQRPQGDLPPADGTVGAAGDHPAARRRPRGRGRRERRTARIEAQRAARAAAGRPAAQAPLVAPALTCETSVISTPRPSAVVCGP